MKLCFATNNINKVGEAKVAIENEFEILTLQEIGFVEELPETKNSLEGNSAQKAEIVWNRTGIPCFADDTGLEVEALNGEPGVFSARYAGIACDSQKNIELLLENLKSVKNRKAQFRTVVSLILPDGRYQFEGITKGVILNQLQGKNGFGYDPIFLPDGFSKSFAEMNIKEKAEISHRAIAIKKLVRFLKSNARV